MNAEATEKLIGNWCLGFKGSVSQPSNFNSRTQFEFENWFNNLAPSKQNLVVKALNSRSKKLQLEGEPAINSLRRAVGELHKTLYGTWI